MLNKQKLSHMNSIDNTAKFEMSYVSASCS